MKEKIESITKFIPIVYPIVVFLGYYNYFIYYSFFDLEIFHYLTIYELLFSFISLIIPIFTGLFLIFCYLIFFALLSTNDVKEKKETIGVDHSHISPVQKRLNNISSREKSNMSLLFNKSHYSFLKAWSIFEKKIKLKKFSRAFFQLENLFFSFLKLVIKLSLWLFFVLFSFASFQLLFSPTEHNLDYFMPFFQSKVSIILPLIFWTCIIYAIIYKATIKGISFSLIHCIPLVFLIMLSLTLHQKIRFEDAINHYTSDIKFNYNGEKIETNSNVIFVGKTSEFIFLRDLKTEANLIYPIKDVGKIEVIKLKK